MQVKDTDIEHEEEKSMALQVEQGRHHIIRGLEYKVISICQRYIQTLREALQKREANANVALLAR